MKEAGMDAKQAFQGIEACGIMAGMRGAFVPDTALRVCETMLNNGINIFEFTYNSEQPVEAMVAVKRAFGDSAVVGMGTVLNLDTAQRVLAANPDFVVSPSSSAAVINTVLAAKVLVAPGVMTPTEIVNAWDMGVQLVKLFPIGTLGVDHFKQIRGPLDHVKYLCNGGMSDVNVGDFIRAGAVACGLGSWLTGDSTAPLERIGQRSRILREIVDAARERRTVSAFA